MTDKIKPDYGVLSATDYTQRINTPAQNPLYHKNFHAPLVQEARGRSVTPTIVDLAAGHAHELVPIAEESGDVRLVAVDVARKVLIDSTRQRIKAKTLLTLYPSASEREEKQAEGTREVVVNNANSLQREIVGMHPDNLVVVADAKDLIHMTTGFADAGIALNAMVYVPYDMLRGLRACLKKGAPASVNFRNASNPHNNPFYDFYVNDGGEIRDDELMLGEGVAVPTRVLDYRQCRDATIRSLDRQIYLTTLEDIAKLINASGFAIESHQPFHFKSPANPNNEIDVFGLRAV